MADFGGGGGVARYLAIDPCGGMADSGVRGNMSWWALLVSESSGTFILMEVWLLGLVL